MLPRVPLQKRLFRSGAILKVSFVMILIAGMVSLYLSTSRVNGAGERGATPITVTETAIALENPYSAYLPGKGTFAFYDSLKADSQGYDWSPPKYTGCVFKGESLHVSIYGDDTHPVYFHVCIGRTPRFKDFAYEIKMTFINGDCGGVVFRSGDPQYDPRLYYFYICQDGQYSLIRYAKKEALAAFLK
jgi:hypothetical protein